MAERRWRAARPYERIALQLQRPVLVLLFTEQALMRRAPLGTVAGSGPATTTRRASCRHSRGGGRAGGRAQRAARADGDAAERDCWPRQMLRARRPCAVDLDGGRIGRAEELLLSHHLLRGAVHRVGRVAGSGEIVAEAAGWCFGRRAFGVAAGTWRRTASAKASGSEAAPPPASSAECRNPAGGCRRRERRS